MESCLVDKKTILGFLIGWLCLASEMAGGAYREVQPRPGEGLAALLKRHGLPATESSRHKFYELNELPAEAEQQGLILGKTYKLPMSHSRKIVNPLFGRAQQVVEPRDNALQDCAFYLVSGHGGPDPGAVGKRGRRRLCEDEYAYDITLRLARRLMEHGARVHVIVQDPNDGIRSGKYLKGDEDERYLGGKAIPADPVQRLRTRAGIINSLYRLDQQSTRKQLAVMLHVDSRSQAERVDIFYYYHPGSRAGQELAETLLETVRQKYAENQPGRSYQSTVTARNLHMLRETEPTAVFIELGNIQNQRDQERLIVENNRQAIANWLCAGLIDACRKAEK